MQICNRHWTKLKEELKAQGLDHLGAKTPEDAQRNIVTELEGRGEENDYDPLMACNNMLLAAGLRELGLGLMAMKEDGTHKCPICEAVEYLETTWIKGPVGDALEEAKRRGLVT